MESCLPASVAAAGFGFRSSWLLRPRHVRDKNWLKEYLLPRMYRFHGLVVRHSGLVEDGGGGITRLLHRWCGTVGSLDIASVETMGCLDHPLRLFEHDSRLLASWVPLLTVAAEHRV